MSCDTDDVLPSEINTKYEIQSLIGSGAYGTVYQAVDNEKHEIVAVKNIRNIYRNMVQGIRCLRELVILRLCDHPNICRLRNVLSPSDLMNYSSVWMVMDNGGKDMLMKLKERNINSLEWNLKDIKWILYQLLCGLGYLHSCKIIHRDIKPSNILINDKKEVKISDFGLSREMKEIENEEYFESELNNENENLSSSMTKHVVTRFYRAPELCLCENYNEKIDVWAVGCIMSELFDYLNPKCEKIIPLFPGSNSILSVKDLVSSEDIKKERYDENSQIYRIIQILGNPPKNDLNWIRNKKTRNFIKEMKNIKLKERENSIINFDKKFQHIEDKNGIELIKSMLIYNPHKRINIKESIKNPFFDEVREEYLEQGIYNDNNWFDESLYEIENIITTTNEIEVLREYINNEFKYYKYMYSPPIINRYINNPTSSNTNTNSNGSLSKSNSFSIEFMDSLKSFSSSSCTLNSNNLIKRDGDSEYIKKTFLKDNNLMNKKYDEIENEEEKEKIRNDIFNDDDDNDEVKNEDNKKEVKNGKVIKKEKSKNVNDKKKKKKIIKKKSITSSVSKTDDKELSRERTRDNRRIRKENNNICNNNTNTKKIIKKKITTTTESRKSKIEMRKVSDYEVQQYIKKFEENENEIKSVNNSRSTSDTSEKEIMEEEVNGEDIFFSNINELF